jgi:hypothetical protein
MRFRTSPSETSSALSSKINFLPALSKRLKRLVRRRRNAPSTFANTGDPTNCASSAQPCSSNGPISESRNSLGSWFLSGAQDDSSEEEIPENDKEFERLEIGYVAHPVQTQTSPSKFPHHSSLPLQPDSQKPILPDTTSENSSTIKWAESLFAPLFETQGDSTHLDPCLRGVLDHYEKPSPSGGKERPLLFPPDEASLFTSSMMPSGSGKQSDPDAQSCAASMYGGTDLPCPPTSGENGTGKDQSNGAWLRAVGSGQERNSIATSDGGLEDAVIATAREVSITPFGRHADLD